MITAGLGATNMSYGLGATNMSYGLGATTHSYGLGALPALTNTEKLIVVGIGAIAGLFFWKHRRKLKRGLRGALGLSGHHSRRRRRR